MKKLLTIICSILVANITWGDSPLTYTSFHQAYSSEPLVQKALKVKSKINKELLLYLATDTNPLDVKLAIINAIGWSNKGIKNSAVFMNHVVKTKQYKSETNKNSITFVWNATADELICYSYLMAMENYFDVSYANEIAQLALKKKPNSLAINTIASLIKSHGLFLLNEWCYAYKQYVGFMSNSSLNVDIRNEASAIIFEYIQTMNTNCK